MLALASGNAASATRLRRVIRLRFCSLSANRWNDADYVTVNSLPWTRYHEDSIRPAKPAWKEARRRDIYAECRQICGCRLRQRSSGGSEVRSSHTSELPAALEAHGSDATICLRRHDVTRDENQNLFLSLAYSQFRNPVLLKVISLRSISIAG